MRRKKISFDFQAHLKFLEQLANDIGILVPKVMNPVVLMFGNSFSFEDRKAELDSCLCARMMS